MTKTAHTPGPWKHNGLKEPYFGHNEHTLAAAVWTADGKHFICGTRYNLTTPSAPDKETADANARLIAAAPDLLEALEYIVNDTPEEGGDAELTVVGYNKACAAIARTTA